MKVTAYIAAVKLERDKTVYVGLKGKLQSVPYFWRTRSALLRRLTPRRWYYGSCWKEEFTGSTSIIIVTDVQLGMKQSVATSMTLIDFREQTAAAKQVDKKGAVYRLTYHTGGVATIAPTSKTWGRASDLRSHLMYDLERLRLYLNAGRGVAEVTYGPDGVTPTGITYIPILQFLERSKVYSARAAQFMQGSASLTTSPGMEAVGVLREL